MARINRASPSRPRAERKRKRAARVFRPGRPSIFVNLGPHPPRLWPEDVDLVHDMWLELSEKYAGAKIHHRDVVGVALRRMMEQLRSDQRDDVIRDILEEVFHRKVPVKSKTDGG